MTRPVYSTRVAILLASLVGASAIAEAQTTTGTIDGVIRDTSGAAVPGVQVVANSPALIQKDLTTYSNQEGYYRLLLLPPGSYTVAFGLQGFQTPTRAGLIVTVGQTTRVDVELKLAAVAESVTVVGQSPTIDPTSAKVSFTYTRALLENVPTGRTFGDLMTTIPGVEKSGNVQNVLGAGSRGNAYTFDGANATDPRVQLNQSNLFPYDIMEEVQVLKGGKPAEVGFAQGGFFQIITKSGGNDFHGVASVYYQTDSLQSNNVTDRLRQAGVTTSDRVINAQDPSVSLGWRFIRDKLWWYGSLRRQTIARELLGLTEHQDERINALFWKTTYQPHSSHRFTSGVTYWDDDTNPSGGGSASLAGDRFAFFDSDQGGAVAYARWNGVLTDRVVLEAGGGWSKLKLNAYEQPGAGVGIYDLVTGMRFRNVAQGALTSGNLFFTRYNPSYDRSVTGSLSWFVPRALGRHSFKFGGEYTRTAVPGRFTQVGDHILALANGTPSQVRIFNTPVKVELDEDVVSAYAQDSWTIRNKLTLNLGVRFDHVGTFTLDSVQGGGAFANTPLAERFPFLNRQSVPGRDLFTFNSTAPRLAGSWAVGSRTAIKGSYSRYYHFMQSQVLPGTGIPEITKIALQWTDRNGDGEYQIGEEGRLLLQTGGFGGGGAALIIDPKLRHPYSDEWIVGISHEILADFSLNANYIARRDDDLTNLLNVGVPFGSYSPVQIVDPGEDGRVGTGDDRSLSVFAQNPASLGRDARLLTNPSRYGFDNTRPYRGLEFVANKRLSHHWQFVGSLVVSRMEVVQTTGDTGQSDQFQSPNSLINARGLDPANRTYLMKLQGTYQAPHDIVVSAFYRLGSGSPYTRQLVVRGLPQGVITVFAEPRGSRTTDTISLVDVRVEKSVRLGRAQLGLALDVFNLTNAAPVTGVGSRTGVDLGTPRAIELPRIARLGARYTW